MPGYFTHYLFGCKTLSVLDNTLGELITGEYRTAFNLGAQGPDIFFFYRAWPWTKTDGIDKTGGMLHDGGICNFFKLALEYIRKQDIRDRGLLEAYLCGFICHYVLDCAAHPFIFNRSGFALEDASQAKKYSTYHVRYETAVDVLMLQRELSLTPYAANAPALIAITGGQTRSIGEMLASTISRAYGVQRSATEVVTAIQDMHRIFTLLRDKHGIKKFLFSSFEAIIGKPGLVSAIIYPTAIKDGIDYLNLSHTGWYLPWDKTAPRHESLPELIEKAVPESKTLCEAADGYLQGRMDLSSVLELLGNRNFGTGLDAGADVPFLYHDCVYEASARTGDR